MVIFEEPDDRFYAAPSTIPGAGRGLFARVPLQTGDRLAVVGVRVRRDSAEDHYTSFADEYKFRAGDYLLVPCGVAALANHSAQPNLEKVVEGQAVFYIATPRSTAGSVWHALVAAAAEYGLDARTTDDWG